MTEKIKTTKDNLCQILDEKSQRYIKMTKCGLELALKTTPGPYKGIDVVEEHPSPDRHQPNRVDFNFRVKKPRKVNYLNNKDMLVEVSASKEQGQMTDKLVNMLQLLAARYGRRSNWAGYTYNEDMQAHAMLSLVRTWHKFDPERSQNPFSFFTQCIKNSFIQFHNSERTQRDIRDESLINNGLSPSLTYQNRLDDGKDPALKHEAEHKEVSL